MTEESALRAQARQVIRSGTLPSRLPSRVWGGPGVDARCSVCEQPVTADQFEVEIAFAHDDDPGLDTYHVHGPCFAAWELERVTPEE